MHRGMPETITRIKNGNESSSTFLISKSPVGLLEDILFVQVLRKSTIFDGVSGANILAFSTADTFQTVGILHWVAPHLADICTSTAADAFF